jgi:hypothetical protein
MLGSSAAAGLVGLARFQPELLHALDRGDLFLVGHLSHRLVVVLARVEDDLLQVRRHRPQGIAVDRKQRGRLAAEIHVDVLLRHLVQLERQDRIREHHPAFVDAGLHRGVRLVQRRLHPDRAGALQPGDIRADGGELAALELRHLGPFEVGDQAVVADDPVRDEDLLVAVLEHFLERGRGLVNVPDDLRRDPGIGRAEGREEGEVVRQELGGLGRRVHVRDVEQAGFDGFEALAELAHRAAPGLGPLDLVPGLGRELGHAGHVDILDGRDPEPDRRVPCADLRLIMASARCYAGRTLRARRPKMR